MGSRKRAVATHGRRKAGKVTDFFKFLRQRFLLRQDFLLLCLCKLVHYLILDKDVTWLDRSVVLNLLEVCDSVIDKLYPGVLF